MSTERLRSGKFVVENVFPDHAAGQGEWQALVEQLADILLHGDQQEQDPAQSAANASALLREKRGGS